MTALALCVPVQASSLLPLSMKLNASPATRLKASEPQNRRRAFGKTPRRFTQDLDQPFYAPPTRWNERSMNGLTASTSASDWMVNSALPVEKWPISVTSR